MDRIEFVAEECDDRLDKSVSLRTEGEMSRTYAAKLINGGLCKVNGTTMTLKNYRLQVGDEVCLTIPKASEAALIPEDIPLDIVYEDDDLLIVNKPKGMVVHPAQGHYSGTLVNALMYHCGQSLSGINGEQRPGIVHRIDMDTSGLLMVAKSDAAHRGLAEQIQVHSFKREYEAVVCGNITEGGTVNAPVGRSKADRKKMCVTAENSREAITYYSVLQNFRQYTHLRLRLETGRTHQIRVHMAYIGHPVAGDAVYGNGKPETLHGQCLHAKCVGFTHPATGEWMEFESELPEYFREFLKTLN
ncbi:MAG: RluA family pseudouridine synthase [Ruminiclostridium sp.]|nr:RluA family pseudouridine synthase [Ruminiclostridium sp.]